jgi:hypothetical protein
MLFVESSAKTKIGIQQVFNEVVQKVRAGRASQVLRAWCGLLTYPLTACGFADVALQILENPALLSNTAPRSRGRKLDGKVEKNGGGGSGCC